jgi:hypothetical protein
VDTLIARQCYVHKRYKVPQSALDGNLLSRTFQEVAISLEPSAVASRGGMPDTVHRDRGTSIQSLITLLLRLGGTSLIGPGAWHVMEVPCTARGSSPNSREYLGYSRVIFKIKSYPCNRPWRPIGL